MEKIAQEARNREEDAIRRYGAAISAEKTADGIVRLARILSMDNCPIEEAIYAMKVAEKQIAYEAVVAATRHVINAEEALHAARMQQKRNDLAAVMCVQFSCR